MDEIKDCYNVIEGFENVAGLKMHRDPARGKCQALPFGKHTEYKDWPEWISVKGSIKVVGIIFTNENEKFESMNTDLVVQNFYNALQKVLGMRGTLFQKVYAVKTFLFSKLCYLWMKIFMHTFLFLSIITFIMLCCMMLLPVPFNCDFFQYF